MRCQEYACSKSAQQCCSSCKSVYYCSKECQRSDWPFHKQLCHVSLSERLRSICDWALKYDEVCVGLSCGNTVFDKGAVKLLSAYPRQERIAYWCAICADSIRFPSTPPAFVTKFDVFYRGHYWTYARCEKCVKVDKLLCPRTLKAKDLCCIEAQTPIIAAFSARHHIGLCVTDDVTLVILELLSRLLPCCKGCQ